MKITKKNLENLIKEELDKLLAEDEAKKSFLDKAKKHFLNRAKKGADAPLQYARPVGAKPIRDQETLDSLIAHLDSSDRVHSPVQISEASGPYGIKDDSGNIATQYMAYTIKLFFETEYSQKLKEEVSKTIKEQEDEYVDDDYEIGDLPRNKVVSVEEAVPEILKELPKIKGRLRKLEGRLSKLELDVETMP